MMVMVTIEAAVKEGAKSPSVCLPLAVGGERRRERIYMVIYMVIEQLKAIS